MLFARAMSNGVRWYCPDVAMTPLYTPDEQGAQAADYVEANAGGKRLDACALAELGGLAEGLELK